MTWGPVIEEMKRGKQLTSAFGGGEGLQASQVEILSEITIMATGLRSVAGLGVERVAGSHLFAMVDTPQVFTNGAALVDQG